MLNTLPNKQFQGSEWNSNCTFTVKPLTGHEYFFNYCPTHGTIPHTWLLSMTAEAAHNIRNTNTRALGQDCHCPGTWNSQL